MDVIKAMSYFLEIKDYWSNLSKTNRWLKCRQLLKKVFFYLLFLYETDTTYFKQEIVRAQLLLVQQIKLTLLPSWNWLLNIYSSAVLRGKCKLSEKSLTYKDTLKYN